MSSTKKPTIVIVHGAWHQPLHYLKLHDLLQARGHAVRIPVLVTSGQQISVPNKSISDDVSVIQHVLQEEFTKGNEVVLVCHSYGGLPGTASAFGQSIEERQANGAAGGVRAVVYIAAFAPPAP